MADESESVSTSEAAKLSQSKLAGSKEPYAHRSHRVKHQEGYGAEGAARGAHKPKEKIADHDDADDMMDEKAEKSKKVKMEQKKG